MPEASLHEGALEEGDRVEEEGEGVPVVRAKDDGGRRGREGLNGTDVALVELRAEMAHLGGKEEALKEVEEEEEEVGEDVEVQDEEVGGGGRRRRGGGGGGGRIRRRK